MASMPTTTAPAATEAQQAIRKRFAYAAQYAKNILLNPEMHAAYSAKAADGRSAYVTAMTDYLRGPSVDEINTEDYLGNPGDLVRVKAIDDFMVTEVAVMLTDANDEVIEAGACEFDPDGGWWKYPATVQVTTLTGTKITAVARDYPGNKAELSITL